MATWILKTEPSEYSWDDLARDGRTTWQGVTSNAALLHLRSIRKDDDALIYHTGDERQIVGLATVARGAYPDPSLDPPDAKRVVVDIMPRKKANPPVPLASIKSDKRFAGLALVQQTRLSVMPVPDTLADALKALAGLRDLR